MVDKKYQGKGYGKAAMQEAIKHVISEYNPETFRTSIVPGNDAAEKLYKDLGFIPTGEIEGGEIVMVLELRAEGKTE
jgi:diamine N-acetyltransferase